MGDTQTLTGLLEAIETKADDNDQRETPRTTMRDIFLLVGRRAYGPLLLLLGLIAVSPLTMPPGTTTVFAVLILAVSVQLALHVRHPRLPKQLMEASLSNAKLKQFIGKAKPTARAVDKVIKPRLTFLADPPWVIVVAVLCIVSALVMFPLSLIPLAPFVPCAAIVVLGLGLTARDGLLIGVSATGMIGAFWMFVSQFL